MALNHVVAAAINLAAALLSIPVIAAGIWLSTQTDNACVNLLQWPLIGLGIAILAVGLAGFVGALWRLPRLLLAYLVAMLILALSLASLVVFVFLVTTGSSGRPVPSRAFLEYDLDDYSGWLRQRLDSASRWDGIKTCLASTPICPSLNQTYATAEGFFAARWLSPVESGCCKPPTRCGYTFVNPTFWISPIDGAVDPDCAAWSNDQAQLCYSCSSCKAGVLQNLRREWRRADLILLVAALGLLAVYAVGCYTFRQAKTDNLFRRYRQGYT
ncbi:protein TORNADO 2 [Brachypodium distachyon]|uniref:Tetraspanin n=1 Tax=Brachypodium distachyon TaxID=15368 RepID=I1H9D1_BRADI|nr:protein TORNADO 2 [Brachypodium distachyon]KQK23471.1 hypothetical protein BRADI_1g74040v3 [Brachypodium distachyon]|eukprot:XP_003558742.1 protein TORNADO 2 [Brachypodium distachyon]